MTVRFNELDQPAELRHGRVPTPVGPVEIVWCAAGICRLGFGSQVAGLRRQFPQARLVADAAGAARIMRQVWAGKPLTVAVDGTVFQRRVWAELVKIPRGRTVTYGELARRVGRPGGGRAVGQAVSANPVGILVPCHRVVAANGKLGGFVWGPARKQWLLRREAKTQRWL